MKNKKGTIYLYATAIVLLLLLAFGITIVVMSFKELSLLETSKKVTDITILSEMQANSLVISGLSVTIVSIIISTLTLVRERRLEISYERLDDALNATETLKSNIRILINLNSVQTLQSHNSGLYYDIIKQYIDNNSENEFSKNLRLELLGISATVAHKFGGTSTKMEAYNSIISEAEKIVCSEEYTHLEKQFAYIELINALYSRARHFRMYKYDVAKKNITLAKSYIQKFSAYNPTDSLGIINNLIGLIYLWDELPESAVVLKNNLHDINYAIEKLSMAIELNKEEPEYKNNLAMALSKRYEILGKEEDFNKAEELLNNLLPTKTITGDSFAPRAVLNLAGLRIKRIQRALQLTDVPISISEIMQKRYVLFDSERKQLEDDVLLAYVNLTTITTSFISSREYAAANYKLAELLTYHLLLKKVLKHYSLTIEDHAESVIPQYIEKCFDESHKLLENALGCLYCERNYYELMRSKKALEINSLIRLGNPQNADVWEERYNAINNQNILAKAVKNCQR